jgi:hypothetical protein
MNLSPDRTLQIPSESGCLEEIHFHTFTDNGMTNQPEQGPGWGNALLATPQAANLKISRKCNELAGLRGQVPRLLV